MSPLAIVLTLSGVFFVLFLIVSAVLFVYKTPGGGRGSGNAGIFAPDAVGIVELNGVIMDSKKTLSRLEAFEETPDVKAVVMRINSPGGAVAPSQEIYDAVRNYKKPIVVSMSSVTASGGYYIAMGAKKVFANPGTITGSIGVIMEFANLKKLYEWAKVERFSIKTGKYKDAGAEFRDMTDDERALLQGMVDDVLVQFKQAVATGRNLTMAEVDKIADGRIFSGAQAKAAKLVDELGGLQDAINEAAKQGKIKGKPRVVYPERPRKLLMELLGEGSRDESTETSVPAVAGGRGERALEGLEKLVRAWAGGKSLVRSTDGVDSEMTPGIYWLWKGASF